MKRALVLVASVLAVLPALSTAVNLTEFQGGAAAVIAGLEAPGFSAPVNLSIPAECHVRKAVLNVASAPGNATFPGDPSRVVLSLDGKALWTFAGQGFGALGNQTVFADGNATRMLDIGPGGGAAEQRIRLMKKAVPGSASLDLELTGKGAWVEKLNWSASGYSEQLGRSVSGAGDVNGDGYGDFLVGEPNYQNNGYAVGKARLFFGGPNVNATADLNFTSISYNHDQRGYSVSDAGDVNGDGYDDIIIGALNAYRSGGSYQSGAAFIYYGGPAMDTIADVALYGLNQYDSFGCSVSGAGDVNRDGYDDVIVGACNNDAAGSDSGQIYIFYGGQSMDSASDFVFNGSASGDAFGYSVSGAGDVNGDGYADVIAGAPYGGIMDNGYARLFFGGQGMGASASLNLTGETNWDNLGQSVSDAGDVNGDGYDDVLIGAPQFLNGTIRPGAAYLLLGGKPMDAKIDLRVEGESDYDFFGGSVSSAGDIDRDGRDDFLVGAPYWDAGTYNKGRAYAFLGGASPDGTPDMMFNGSEEYDQFGWAVSGAGDVNEDGRSDFLVGAPYANLGNYDTGRAYLFSWVPGILDPELSVGGRVVFSAKGYINATKKVDCLQAVAACLSTAIPNGTDQFDNRYVDVPVVLRAQSDGRAVLDNISIPYEYESAVPDFGEWLEEYRLGHKNAADQSGNLAVPLQVSASSGGRVRLSSLSVNYDDAPALLAPVPELALDEDTANGELADLHQFFVDDVDPAEVLSFSIVMATNSSLVALAIQNNRFLSADALEGEANDNWTGTVEAVVSCSDHFGSRRLSNPFTVVVQNVNDAPVITSRPPAQATAGEPYVYDVTADDGDHDVLVFKLAKAPAGMAINATSGRLEWTPPAGGLYDVTVLADDGKLSDRQSFTVSVPNRPPRFTSAPPAGAFVGVPLVYNLTAWDDDNDTLTWSLPAAPPGMTLSPGRLSWTPGAPGAFPVSIEVSDGKASAWQNFTLAVTQPNRAPKFTSTPPGAATAEVPLVHEVRAVDDDGDPVALSLSAGPPGMALEAGRLSWTPAGAGNFTVVLAATDGKGGSATQEFLLRVSPAVRPVVLVAFPSSGQSVEGKAEFSGTVQRGTHPVEKVEARIDGGGWMGATGTESWRLTFDAGKLRRGAHAVEVRAFDGKGWSEPVTVVFRIEKAAEDGNEGLSLMVLLGVAAALIAMVALAAAAMMRRRAPPPGKGPAEAPAGPPPAAPAGPGALPAVPPPTPLPPEPSKPKPPEREFTP
jgi:hypothetical protein